MKMLVTTVLIMETSVQLQSFGFLYTVGSNRTPESDFHGGGRHRKCFFPLLTSMVNVDHFFTPNSGSGTLVCGCGEGEQPPLQNLGSKLDLDASSVVPKRDHTSSMLNLRVLTIRAY